VRSLIILAFAISAQAAEFKTGNILLGEMNHPDSLNQMVALGYVQGIADANDGITHCLPDGITAGQVRDMTRNYLISNPAIRHLLASLIVGHVLKSSFPCKKGTGTNT